MMDDPLRRVRDTHDSGLRIGIDVRRLHRTGIGRYARNILAACAAEAPEISFVAVLNDHADIPEIQRLAPSAHCIVAPASQYSLKEILRVPSAAGNVDIWHSPHPYHLSGFAKYRTVLTLLDLTQVNYPFGLVNRLAREPLRALMWSACRRADAFTAISETTRDAFVSQMGVSSDRIYVTRLAPDPIFGIPADPDKLSAMRRQWGLTAPLILYVGMAQPHKNLRGLIRAVSHLHRAGSNSPPELAVAGPLRHSERVRLERDAHRAGFVGSIRWLGWLADDDLRLAYHVADVLVLPSFSEGFGLTLLEAMQCGTPCVAADIPVLREIAGNAAVFVDPHSPEAIAGAIAAVIERAGIAVELRELGFANLRRFSWAAAAKNTLAAYQAAVRTRA